ncbi:MAG: flagellar export protein FliJ [SAR86 cluster bacterium]|uniref:Flagellar FliJ protein n=1 Tax=SAR86 cluster bacterium TaxID=2030880 RepID=A0A2A4XGK7_9GAMM|nr:MAG: flagellar export protein FliJ [SAR86 cluster bacterium]
MKRSEKFRKFSEISSGLENSAGAELAAARSQLDAQKNQLQELKSYLGEYQRQLQAKLGISDSALVINGYQQFISSLNGAITLQTEIVRKSETATEDLRENWIEKRLEVNKFDQAAENIRSEEIAHDKKVEQSESDDRVLNSFRRAKLLSDLEAAS